MFTLTTIAALLVSQALGNRVDHAGGGPNEAAADRRSIATKSYPQPDTEHAGSWVWTFLETRSLVPRRPSHVASDGLLAGSSPAPLKTIARPGWEAGFFEQIPPDAGATPKTRIVRSKSLTWTDPDGRPVPAPELIGSPTWQGGLFESEGSALQLAEPRLDGEFDGPGSPGEVVSSTMGGGRADQHLVWTDPHGNVLPAPELIASPTWKSGFFNAEPSPKSPSSGDSLLGDECVVREIAILQCRCEDLECAISSARGYYIREEFLEPLIEQLLLCPFSPPKCDVGPPYVPVNPTQVSGQSCGTFSHCSTLYVTWSNPIEWECDGLPTGTYLCLDPDATYDCEDVEPECPLSMSCDKAYVCPGCGGCNGVTPP